MTFELEGRLRGGSGLNSVSPVTPPPTPPLSKPVGRRSAALGLRTPLSTRPQHERHLSKPVTKPEIALVSFTTLVAVFYELGFSKELPKHLCTLIWRSALLFNALLLGLASYVTIAILPPIVAIATAQLSTNAKQGPAQEYKAAREAGHGTALWSHTSAAVEPAPWYAATAPSQTKQRDTPQQDELSSTQRVHERDAKLRKQFLRQRAPKRGSVDALSATSPPHRVAGYLHKLHTASNLDLRLGKTRWFATEGHYLLYKADETEENWSGGCDLLHESSVLEMLDEDTLRVSGFSPLVVGNERSVKTLLLRFSSRVRDGSQKSDDVRPQSIEAWAAALREYQLMLQHVRIA
tara:strand:+ start:289 stop:1338 length:1050 start_codon:yes stop_codon:yes gene_type:complete